MDDQQLIQLVRETLPEDLSEQHVVQLRKAMKSRPAVREALLEELHVGEAIAARLAPEFTGAEQLVVRLQQLDVQRKRSRRLWLLLGLLVVGGSVALAWQAMPHIREFVDANLIAAARDEGKAKKRKAEATPKGSDEHDSRPAEPPETDADETPDVEVVGSGGTATPGKGDTPQEPAETAAPKVIDRPAKRDPAWRLFDDVAARGEPRWLAAAERLLSPLRGAQFDRNDQQSQIQLNGKFKLTPPTADGRVVRLRMSTPQRLQFMLQAGDQHARIEWADGQLLRGYVGRREQEPSQVMLPEDIDSQFRREQILQQIDEKIDFAWDSKGPHVAGQQVGASNFAVLWTGRIVVPRAGRYRFFTTSDDGVALYVNGRRIIYNWTDHSPTENHGDIELTAGAHELAVEYFQREGGAVLVLDWQGPELRRQRVPADVLQPPKDFDAPPGQRGLLGTYCFGPAGEIAEAIPWKLTTDDGWRWRFFRGGAIDLRYQDGYVILARGDVVLLALPLEQPPSRVTLDTQCVLRSAEVLQLEPLDVSEASLAAGRGYPVSTAEKTGPHSAGDAATWQRPGEISWAIEPEPATKVAEFSKQPDGSMILQRDEKSDAEVWALTPVDVGSGVEVSMQLNGAAERTGFAFESYLGRHYFAVARRPDGNVVCNNPSDPNNVAHMQRTVGTFGDRIFCRIVYGLGHVRADVSDDGLRWRYLWHHDVELRKQIPQTVRVGLYLQNGAGPRRVQLQRIAIHRPQALESFADARLVQKALAAMADVPDRRHNWTKALESARNESPSGITPELWRLACLTAALREADVPLVRRSVVMEILDEAIAQNVPFDRVLAGLQELPRRASISMAGDAFCKWSDVHELYDRLAARELDAGRSENLDVLLNAWYRQDYGLGIRGYFPEFVAPYGLVRLQLYGLRARQEFKALRAATLRYLFMERSGDGAVTEGALKTDTPKIAAWMLHDVHQYLPDTPRATSPAARRGRAVGARHPFVSESDREATNTISEFLSAVNDKQYPYAARMLTQRSLPDGIVPLDANGELSKETFVLLREQIEAHPGLQDVLDRDYTALGMLRLRQHVDHGQYDQLESLATQFHGTQAAREALALLADRDLAIGNFFSAAALYEQIMQQSPGEFPQGIAAKRRLALAMTGQLAGDPVKEQVQFSGQTMSAGEFEALIRALVAERSIVAKKVGGSPQGPRLAPPPGNLQVTGDMRIWMEPHPKYKRQDVAWSVGDKYLAVQTYSRFYMIDRDSKRLLWHKDHQRPGDKPFAAIPHAPLILQDRVVAAYHRGGKTKLACFAAHDGKEQWQQPLDVALVSDPLLIGSWIYVFCVQHAGLEGYADIVLKRLSPQTGESLLTKRVIRLRSGDSPLFAGRPALVDDALLLRIGGGLVCCDLMGETRWIRRLAYVPSAIDNRLHESSLTSSIVIDENRVILASAGSPSLVCIDAASGEEIWSRVAPDVRNIVGPISGKVICTCPQRVIALDAKTGAHAWQRDTMADGQSVLAAARDTVLTVTVDPQKKQGQRRGELSLRRVQWLAAADGRTVKEIDLPQRQNEVFDAGALVSDGKRIFGVSSFVPRSRDVRLFWIEPK